MKRQVLQGLAIMLLCFLIGGAYIIYAIGDATSQLERAVTIHQAHDTIVALRHGIFRVQNELKLKSKPQTADLALLQTDIEGLKKNINSCFHCEYSKGLLIHLGQLQALSDHYIGMLEQLRKLAPEAEGSQVLIAATLRKGVEFSTAVEAFIKNVSGEFPGRSKTLYHDITKVKHLIIFLVIVGPIAILMMTAYFLKRFTGSVEVLVQASNILKNGNLDYRVDQNLKYEFKQLADSFNSMSSSLKLQQEDLQAARKLYQALFESAGDGIFILDIAEGRDGQIISVNPAAAVMHGYKVEELLGMNIKDFSCDDECSERLQCALAGSWLQYEVARRKKDGTMFLAEVSVGLIDMGEHKYALLFSRDITQRRKEAAELQRANQMALVGEMAAGLAHEIKNPLAGIKVSLEVLADELELNEEDQELFGRVINETNRVEKLLKGLLNYARPPQLHYERFDLNRLLDYSIQNLSVTGKTSSKQGVDFIKHYATDLPQLEADSAQLQQVILNILLNAIEAMPEGGTIDVTTARQSEEEIKIKIQDSGKGIPQDVIASIFHPFVTTKSKGTGLGLAICKRIIEEHGGTIDAVNHDDGGTLFTIVLPLKNNKREILQ